MNIICFHNPDEEYGYLSNWYLLSFEADGIMFSSMEQYMMYHKALTFHDNETAAEILETNDVARIKEFGRQVANYDDTVWNGVRQIVVYEGLRLKFSQNADLQDQLVSTGNAVLAEAAVHDKVWGIGLSMYDDRRFDIAQWKGQNLLGFSLMKVRDQLVHS